MRQNFNIVLLFCIIFIDQLSSSEKTSTQQAVKSREDALSWFNKYGYNPCLNSTAQCSISFSSLLGIYQKLFHLKETGILDEPTKQHMSRPRCGNLDKPIAQLNSVGKPSSIAEMVRDKWSRSSLKYSLRGCPTQLSEATTKPIIREAFKAWTDHIPLTIEEVCSTCKADLVLDFSREQHADGYPFDGVGGTLAHAFFPEDGRVHFDKDEPWTERFDNRNINLYLVAVHEIGHALGLNHVYDERSIMYPSYQLMTKSNILPQPDRESIQRLYGRKQSSAVAPPPPPKIPTVTPRKPTANNKSSVTPPVVTTHPRCRLFLDAAFNHPDGTLHTFNAGILWRYLPDEHTWDERASTVKQTYPDLPNKLAAGAYNSRTKEAFFFTNARAYHYDIDHRNRAKLRKEHKLSKTLQNSIAGAIYYHSAIYVITRKTLRLFELDNGYQQADERDLSEEFPRFTGLVTTAFSYGDLHHFFTSDRLVYVWSERLNTWKTFGKPMESNWFACSGSETYVIKNSDTDKSMNHQGSHRRHHHHHHHHHD